MKAFIYRTFLLFVALLSSSTLWGLEVYYLNEKDNLSCPTGLFKELKKGEKIIDRLENINFNPKCLWEVIQLDAFDHGGEVHGFAYGVTYGIGYKVASMGHASELVIMKYDDESLMVGFVHVKGYAVDFSLPLGASLAQTVIFGDCPESLQSYLGWFRNITAIAKTKSEGTTNFPLSSEGWKTTGCNALSSTRGLTSAIVGLSVSYYFPASDFVLIKGPRIKAMLGYINALNVH